MIESNDGVPPQRPPYIVGEILSDSEADKKELPGIDKYLFQAVVVGVLIGLSFSLISVVPYAGSQVNLLLLLAVSAGITYGVAFAMVEAIVIWACTYIARHRLHPLARAAIGAAVPYLVIDFWIVFSQRHNEFISPRDYLHWLVSCSVVGAVCGLVIGSNRLGASS